MILKTQNLKLKTKKRGFTLVETLVATFVLITAIVGPMTIVAKGVFFSNLAKNQITAFYLAQEALEYIRNKRDNNTFVPLTWNQFKQRNGSATPPGIQDCLATNNPAGCTIDVITDTISACVGTCALLNQNSVSGLYSYQSGVNWSPSLFRRTIKAYNEPSTDANANEIRLEIEIAWQNGTFPRSFILKDNLLNWQ